MTPAEFYVSSDALVHLQIPTEYLSKSCRTVGWMPCPASKLAVRRGQSTTDRQCQRKGLKCIMNI